MRSRQNELFQLERQRKQSAVTTERVIKMRDEYVFSKGKPNPYADKLKKQITIRLNAGTIEYFKRQAEETGISYQNLINMYLTDCAVREKN